MLTNKARPLVAFPTCPGGIDIATNRIELPRALVEETALEWLESDAEARAIVDSELNILWANLPATTLLGSASELEARSGVLSTVDRSRQPELQKFISATGAARSVWSLPRAGGEGFLLIISARAGRADRFGLLLRNVGPEFRSDYRELDIAFGLTVAEHRVLLSLLAGKEADVIAGEQGVSIETTRSHIRSIYLKLGVNSRERLFALAQGFQI